MMFIANFNMFIAIFIVFFLVSFSLILKGKVSNKYLLLAIIISTFFGLTVVTQKYVVAYYIAMISNFVLFGWIISIKIYFNGIKLRYMDYHIPTLIAVLYGFSSSFFLLEWHKEMLIRSMKDDIIIKVFNINFEEHLLSLDVPFPLLIISTIIVVLTYIYTLFFYIYQVNNLK